MIRPQLEPFKIAKLRVAIFEKFLASIRFAFKFSHDACGRSKKEMRLLSTSVENEALQDATIKRCFETGFYSSDIKRGRLFESTTLSHTSIKYPCRRIHGLKNCILSRLATQYSRELSNSFSYDQPTYFKHKTSLWKNTYIWFFY